MSPAAKPQPSSWLRIAVSGDSMLPTLRNNDMLLLRRSDRFRSGQLVLLEDHAFRLTIKRLSHQIQDQWWVVGDNVENSIDSRSYGAVSTHQLQAVVIARYWPRPKLFRQHFLLLQQNLQHLFGWYPMHTSSELHLCVHSKHKTEIPDLPSR